MGFDLESRRDHGGTGAILTATALVGFLLPFLIESMFLTPERWLKASPALLIGIPTGISLGSILVVLGLLWFGKTRTLVVVGWTVIFALIGMGLSVSLADFFDLTGLPLLLLTAGSMIGAGGFGLWMGVAGVRRNQFEVPDLPEM